MRHLDYLHYMPGTNVGPCEGKPGQPRCSQPRLP